MDTEPLDEKMARLMRARHHFVVGLADLEHVHREILLDSMSPLQEKIEAARRIISDFEGALYAFYAIPAARNESRER